MKPSLELVSLLGYTSSVLLCWVPLSVYDVMDSSHLIMLTCPCNVDHITPHVDHITPHFYIVKRGLTGVYIFSYFRSKT